MHQPTRSLDVEALHVYFNIITNPLHDCTRSLEPVGGLHPAVGGGAYPPEEGVYPGVTNICTLYKVMTLRRVCTPTLHRQYTLYKIPTGIVRGSGTPSGSIQGGKISTCDGFSE